MEKIDMRNWVSSLESVIDNKLRKWRKENKIENGEVVQLRWQFEQSHIHLDIFWHDKAEIAHLQFFSPRTDHSFRWHDLNDVTFNRIMDRVGNLAQITMHPPVGFD
jgi:hypothetical protein